MRTFFAVLLSAVALLFAVVLPAAQAQGQVGVPEIEKYFNAIRTMKARFVQTNPNGSIIQGTLYVRRPGRMRFEYDPPSRAQDRGRRLPGDDVGSDDQAISASGRSAGPPPRSWSRNRFR